MERDRSFLRRYLTEQLMRELNLFEHEARGDERVITRVADEESWRDVKETLIRSVGMGNVPVVTIEDADYNQNRVLFLVHDYDGRSLDLESAEKTLGYVERLWGREVVLQTVLNEKKSLLSVKNGKLVVKGLRVSRI